ncbi:MAG: tRNA (adenosine(37)-N6)-dimethylallyltransferase MiaA [Desulfobulbus sp.]|nr:tRNA (adenosine(37)-N6)-dimethylallyltransferase MiaA [Desulfobulbus sp.]
MSESQLITSPVIVLVGPTAIGKTALSLEIAERYGCEIISMDSMQVYRFMDIGTAKATLEERDRVRHHLIDIVTPDDQYDAARFVADTLTAIKEITERNRIPLITGGTGLYLSALLKGLFEEIRVPQDIREHFRQRLEQEGREVLHRELCAIDQESGNRIHLNDTQRLLRGLEIFQATGIPWSEHIRRQSEGASPVRFTRLLQIGLRCERSLLYDRIKMRTFSMMRDEFQQEVEQLLAKGYGAELSAMQSIGYRHMMGCLAKTWDRPTATAALIQDTRHYAKRQLTWFGRSKDIHWYDVDQPATVLADIDTFLIHV